MQSFIKEQEMGKTLDLGRRIELHSMDKYCHEISLGLYRKDAGGVPRLLVHTYSSSDGADARVAFIVDALRVMLGMKNAEGRNREIVFPCGTVHLRALKRAFLDLCKLETGAELKPRPLTAHDKKADGDLTAVNVGGGAYEIRSEDGSDAGNKRAVAVARGFAKICEMTAEGDPATRIRFSCGSSHDELIGMLMFRAQNVRAAMQEEEMASTKGVLAAPSQQI